MPFLKMRKLADTSRGERIPRFDPGTGQKRLVNPATGRPEPWPTAGLIIEGEILDKVQVSSSWVEKNLADKLIKAENLRTVSCPGGPPDLPWRSDKVHNFPQADYIILESKDGPVRYRVVKQPGKFYLSDGALVGNDNLDRYGTDPTEVRWTFDLEREEG